MDSSEIESKHAAQTAKIASLNTKVNEAKESNESHLKDLDNIVAVLVDAAQVQMIKNEIKIDENSPSIERVKEAILNARKTMKNSYQGHSIISPRFWGVIEENS